MTYDLEWVYDIYILEMWHIFSIILSVAFISYIFLNGRKSLLLYYYLFLQGIILAWLVFKVFKTIAPTVELKWVFIVGQYIAICFLGSVFLMFSYLYARSRPLNLFVSILINIPPLVFLTFILTNEKHHLFYSSYDFMGDTFGAVFYIYTAYTYLCLVAGIYLCSTTFKKQFAQNNRQSRLFTIGILIPFIINGIYVSGYYFFRFDITPVSTNISLLIFAYAIYKYRFLDIVPAGIISTLDNLHEGILIVDRRSKVLFINKTLKNILKLKKKNVDRPNKGDDYRKEKQWGNYKIGDIDSRIMELTKDFNMSQESIIQDLLNQVARDSTDISREIILGNGKKCYYLISVSYIDDLSYIVSFTDMTEYRSLIYKLEEKKQQLLETNKNLEEYNKDMIALAILEERNRLAGEIHDVLGNSLTLILNILEYTYGLWETNHLKALEKLESALLETRKGIDNIDKLFAFNKGKINTFEYLKLELQHLVKRYGKTGSKVKLNIDCKDIIEDKLSISKVYYTILRISQEALTNAIKHGDAKEINIFIRINQREADIYILDNGLGCNTFNKGNGLKGMEQRVKNLRGRFSCGSPDNKGFNIHAHIPF